MWSVQIQNNKVMEIAKLKYYSTEKLEGILNELENGDGGRGMNDLMTIEYIKDLIDIREYNAWLFIINLVVYLYWEWVKDY